MIKLSWRVWKSKYEYNAMLSWVSTNERKKFDLSASFEKWFDGQTSRRRRRRSQEALRAKASSFIIINY